MDLHRKPETQEELQQLQIAIQRQLKQIMSNNTWVDCATCESGFPLWKLYRCYYCGLWVCENCAPEHFGGKRELMATIKTPAVEDAQGASGVRCG